MPPLTDEKPARKGRKGRAPTSGTRHGNGGGNKPASGKTAPAFSKDSPTRVLASDTNHEPETQEYRLEQRRKNRERRALVEANTIKMEDRFFDVAMGKKDATLVQLGAARFIHAIWNPVDAKDANESGIVITGGLPDAD